MSLFNNKKKICALVACSNPLSLHKKKSVENLKNFFLKYFDDCYVSPYLYEANLYEPIYETKEFIFDLAKKKAKYLNNLFKNKEVELICDISGGDLANEILPYLEWEEIVKSKALFVGYSDVTVILQALYQKTKKITLLYQARHLIEEDFKRQQLNFLDLLFNKSLVVPTLNLVKDACLLEKSSPKSEEIKYSEEVNNKTTKIKLTYQRESEDKELLIFKDVREEKKTPMVEGVLLGGNLRCLLKLAGTEYFPDFSSAILFIEGYSGDLYKFQTYFAQLKQLGVFAKIKALILGSFLEIKDKGYRKQLLQFVKENVPSSLLVLETEEVGHEYTSKYLLMGEKIRLTAEIK